VAKDSLLFSNMLRLLNRPCGTYGMSFVAAMVVDSFLDVGSTGVAGPDPVRRLVWQGDPDRSVDTSFVALT